RKRAARKDEDEGKVRKGIGQLRTEMEAEKARTLGQYLSQLSPTQRRIRGPERWTGRGMYEEEFEHIWKAQARHHATVLTPELKKELHDAIFFQRRPRFDRNTIGECELERGERRAPKYLLTSQRFRLLQTVNNLRLLPPGEAERELTPCDREKVLSKLELQDELTFKQIRELLKLPDDYIFKSEAERENRVIGNRTSAAFYKAFGERWLKMSPAEREHAVEYLHSFQRAEKLADSAKQKWSLDDKSAEKLSEISLEPDYFNLSRKALEKLLPLLEQGLSFMEAREKAYHGYFKQSEPLPKLPALALEETQRRIGVIRNPAVQRSLTELRKVVNTILRTHGLPSHIHLELARELKKPKKVREAIGRRNDENQARRKKAIQKIKEITGDPYPSRDDIRRVQLLDECRCGCVYCGNPISCKNFLGEESQVDVDHIIPFSRSLDDSYVNLVLCHAACNRAKGDRTPFEAFSGDADNYERIRDRVGTFTGDRRSVAEKVRRFRMNDEELKEFLANFQQRQLNDTAYASQRAQGYLGLLYGGVLDAQSRRRVQASSGQATARFRSLWKLYTILGDGPSENGGRLPKDRTDHRHHAVDAVVIALTNAAMIKRLSDAAQRAPAEHRRLFARLDQPWNGFLEDVRAEIDRIVPSHRVSHKISGALHEETIFSAPKSDGKARVRKPLAKLTKGEIEEIADETVKRLVLTKLKELGKSEPERVFSIQENLPRFPSSGVIIKNARIIKAERPILVGRGPSERYVASGDNHHVEIYAELDRDEREIAWDGKVVSTYNAYRRLRSGEPIIQRDHGASTTFKFSLAKGDTIGLREDGQEHLYVVKKIGPQISLIRINDARKITTYFNPRINGLFHRGMRKLAISPLGEVSEAHD
ncbi:MAG: type II CRISPR RNA-guided endonuclease Cas9, partial [Candidatus Acidiferrales bacterium]